MAVKLKLDGKPFVPRRPINELLEGFLEAAPADELYTCAALEEHLNLNQRSVRDAFDRIPKDYTATVGRSRYFGHPKAIAELRKQVGA